MRSMEKGSRNLPSTDMSVKELKKIVDEQAEDWDLWRVPELHNQLARIDKLQKALRLLHDKIEEMDNVN